MAQTRRSNLAGTALPLCAHRGRAQDPAPPADLLFGPMPTGPLGTLPDTDEDVAAAVVGRRSIDELEADVRAVNPFEPMGAESPRASTARFAPHPGRSVERCEKRRG